MQKFTIWALIGLIAIPWLIKAWVLGLALGITVLALGALAFYREEL